MGTNRAPRFLWSFRENQTYLPCLLCLLASTTTFAADAAPTAAPSPAQDGTLPALTSIAGQATLNNHALVYLEELSDTIGGRVTGSPQANQAVQWGVAKMQAIGLSNVHAVRGYILAGLDARLRQRQHVFPHPSSGR